MNKLLTDTLLLLGLGKKEIKFFQSAYRRGPAPITTIAKDARMQRSTAYLIAEELLSKGLLEEDFQQYRKKVRTIEPEKLIRLLASRQRAMQRQELEMKDNLSELQSLYQASEVRPNVRVFQGKSGLLSIWQDILSQQQEILLWTNQETESRFFSAEFHQKFINDRIAKKIPVRVLAVNNHKGTQLQTDNSDLLRQVKLLPEQITFSAETYIYGNKVAILDYTTDIMGIILESKQIADTQRAIFEMNWQMLEQKES